MSTKDVSHARLTSYIYLKICLVFVPTFLYIWRNWSFFIKEIGEKNCLEYIRQLKAVANFQVTWGLYWKTYRSSWGLICLFGGPPPETPRADSAQRECIGILYLDTKVSGHAFLAWCTLQMKGRWESDINAWFPFMYSQKWNCAASFFPEQNYNVLSPNSYTHISVRDLYIFPGSVCLFCCSQICGRILGINKSLTDSWMWKLGLRLHNSQKKRNT
jgi:hypothetical protein